MARVLTKPISTPFGQNTTFCTFPNEKMLPKYSWKKIFFLGFFPKQHTIAAIDAVKYSFWREKKIFTYFCAMNMFRWTCLLAFLHQNSSGDFCIFSMLPKFSNPVFQNLTIFAALHPMLRLHFFSKAFDVQRVLFTFLRSKSCRNIYRRQNLDQRVPYKFNHLI